MGDALLMADRVAAEALDVVAQTVQGCRVPVDVPWALDLCSHSEGLEYKGNGHTYWWESAHTGPRWQSQ